jgi:hypothetical protein
MSLVLPAMAARTKFHQFEGENLIQADQVPPTEVVAEQELGGKKLTLEITTDKDRIGVMPGSKIKFTVRLLVDGAPLRDMEQLSEIFSGQGRSVQMSAERIPKVLKINARRLDQNLNINFSSSTDDDQSLWFDDGTSKNRARDILLGNYCEATAQPYWSPIVVAKKPQAEITNQLISEQLTSYSKDEGVALFDFSKAAVDFEFVYGGVRILPFIEIAAGLTTVGSSQKVVFFEDQFTSRASRVQPATVSEQEPVVEYQVDFDRGALTPGVPTELKLTVSAHNPKNGQVFTSPWQRVRITAVPLYKIPNVTSLGSYGSSGRPNNYQNPYFDDNTPFNPMVLPSRIQSGLTVEMPGTFNLNEEEKSRYGVNLSMSDYQDSAGGYGGGSLAQSCVSPSAIELDLIEGVAEIPFSYNGNIGPSGQLVFVIQPANYFIPYGVKDTYYGWAEGQPVDFSEYFARRLGAEEYKARKEELITYREKNNIQYPVDRLPENAFESAWASLGYPFIAMPNLPANLYGGTWFKYDDFANYRSQTYTVVGINIGSGIDLVTPQLGFWWWILIGHLIKIAIVAFETVYLRRKAKTVKRSTNAQQ